MNLLIVFQCLIVCPHVYLIRCDRDIG